MPACARRQAAIEAEEPAPTQATQAAQPSPEPPAEPPHTLETLSAAEELYIADTKYAAAVEALYAASIETAAAAQALYAAEASSDIYAPPSAPIAIDEEDIPVIEPKKVEPRKAYIEPVIMIQVLGAASSIRIDCEEEFTLSFGSNIMTMRPGSEMTFRPRSAKVSIRSYSVGIGTFDTDEYEDARTLAELWKKKGYTVRIIKAGGPLVQADGTISDTTIYWVALGRFRDERSAGKFKDKMFSWGISAWVIDESLLGPRGNIEAVGKNGRARIYADSRISITSEAPIRIHNVPFGQGFWSSGKSEDRRYDGPLEIIVDKRGKLAALNQVSMEEYIKGVVPVEIRLSAHDEALKTQAVAARTETTSKLGIKHLYDPFDFCASQHCQEFGGLTRRTSRTDAAVDATRGQVLMRNADLVEAVYSANCGGHTEHNDLVWSSRPNASLRGVSDLHDNPRAFRSPIPSSQLRTWVTTVPRAYCSDSRVGAKGKFRWAMKYSQRSLKKTINKHRRVGNIKDIVILKRGVSGRAIKMKIVGDRDVAIINKELQIRRVLGGLKSSMFIVDIARDSSGAATSFTFRGGGWGHGVGMCQSGAEGMALRDFSYSEILGHYFAETEIKTLYD
jgi:SpoIID/LytB domain protein